MTVVRPWVAALFVVGASAAVLVGARDRSGSVPLAARTIVIAELFTSEGCSSCPPADDLLRELVATQPIDGVEVVALGSHVDYWDRLGWRDPFSSPVFSARQSAYAAAVFRSDRIYTPQLVVDGRLEVVGGDRHAVQQALRAAAHHDKAAVLVTVSAPDQGRMGVEVAIDVPPHQTHAAADVLVAVTEDDLVTRVQRGENGGRTLSHTAVVRSLTTVGRLAADARTATVAAVIPVAAQWQMSNLRIVALVQEQASRRIVGAGATRPGQFRQGANRAQR